MTWLEKAERHYSSFQFHEFSTGGICAVTSPDDNRIAILSKDSGKIILTQKMLKAICKEAPTIMKLFCKP